MPLLSSSLQYRIFSMSSATSPWAKKNTAMEAAKKRQEKGGLSTRASSRGRVGRGGGGGGTDTMSAVEKDISLYGATHHHSWYVDPQKRT